MIPDAETVYQMAAGDAADAVERVRRWSGEQPAMPLLPEVGGQTSLHRSRVEQKIAERWPDTLWEEYRAAFKVELDKENAHVMEQPGRDPARVPTYVVNLAKWEPESPPASDGGFNPDAGWRRRARD